MHFNSKIFILPGLDNSGEQHWQTYWEKKYPEFERINQQDWITPICSDWIEKIDSTICQYDLSNVILVGHSLACCTVVFWYQRYKRNIKGALLVAPSDTEAPSYPPGTTGFTPMPLVKIPFKSIVAASTNDYYVTNERAKLFADAWGSELVFVGNKGHINSASGLGEWSDGLELLKKTGLTFLKVPLFFKEGQSRRGGTGRLSKARITSVRLHNKRT